MTKLKCRKWKKEKMDHKMFLDIARHWDGMCQVSPSVKLLRFLEAIEDHTEAYSRLHTATLSDSSFDQNRGDIIKECVKLLEQVYGKMKIVKITDIWRTF